MAIRIIGIGTLALVAASSVMAQGQGDRRLEGLPPVLQKSLRAAEGLRYSGERVIEVRERNGWRRTTEFVWKDGPRIRVEYSDDSPMRGQIMVDDGKYRSLYRPDKNEIERGPSRRDEIIMRLVSLGRGQKEGRPSVPRVDNGGEVAGVQTQRVTFSDPRGNPGHRLWVDPNSGAILKREIYDPVGSKVASYEFKKIDFNPSFKRGDFVINRQGATIVTPLDQALRAMRLDGFLKVFIEDNRLPLDGVRVVGPGGQKNALQLVYQTERGPLSLMQFKGEIRLPMLDRRMDGRLRSHRWTYKGRNFVLIGEMSEEHLKTIAQKAQERS